MTDAPRLSRTERQLLTILRQSGPQPRAALAQPLGLSAQTVSNLARRLIKLGLITEGEAIRGKVGQPLTPLALDPNGALFLGIKIGRRLVEIALVDFTGTIRLHRQEVRPFPHPDRVLSFARKSIAAITSGLPRETRDRIAGLGVAAPFRMWDWGVEMAPWRGFDLAAELAATVPFPVILENDASTACGGELMFGARDLPPDFLYLYIGYYAGGGLVLDGRLRLGPNRNAAAIGSMPAPGGGQVLDIASMAALETRLGRRVGPEDADWDVPEPVLADWAGGAARALAEVAVSAAALCDLGAVVIDGALPAPALARLVDQTRRAVADLPAAGIDLPELRQGTLGRRARVLGAAALPLARGFLPQF